MVIEGGDDMEKSILKFETMTETDLQEIQGGAFPLLIPVAVGFVKSFLYIFL